MNNKKKIAEQLIFELIDKIARFLIHIDQINRQFYNHADIAVRDKSLFIDSFKKTLNKYIVVAKMLYENIDEENIDCEDIIVKVRHSIRSLNLLHEKYLIDLPRPAEPIELRRFWRVIKKQVVILDNLHDKEIAIFINEEVGEGAYPNDPLESYNVNVLNNIIEDINGYVKLGFLKGEFIDLIDVDNERETYSTFHITIPRIDTSNPCKWPCLVHELSHRLFKNAFAGNIKDNFLSSLTREEKNEIHEISNEINLESWLKEAWCDLFASVLMGPAFLFSQYSAFLNDFAYEKATHPPILFRLKLIQSMLKHRFPKNLISHLDSLAMLCDSTIKSFDEYSKHKSTDLNIRQLFQYFKVYFLNHFFIKDEKGPAIKPVQLNDNLKKLVGKYIENLDWQIINNLINSLNEKLPIPSKKINNNPFKEEPTSVQEIFLAGCVYRNTSFKENILKKFRNLSFKNSIEIERDFRKIIIEDIAKFDQSILRSIQVSEWFDLYFDRTTLSNSGKEDVVEVNKPLKEYKNLLSDFQIKELMARSDDYAIRIIPIINFEKQLGTTSFDIRLGTSFELYHTNQYGIIDFTDDDTTNEAFSNSTKVDKDFLESITIIPGQFILGHSMEYIKLPDNVSADLEGRSSFARLGLEIHMTAGFVDPGFEGVLTFEIYNAGPNPIRLFPGLRIAQLRFIPIDNPSKPYGHRHGVKYKGLLEHHVSKQAKDDEIEKLKKGIEEAKLKNSPSRILISKLEKEIEELKLK
jgi:dCTP deaminase